MSHESSWPIILRAAAGGLDARHAFTRRYLPVMRAYLAARWQGNLLTNEIDDAIQEAFLECFREDGALQTMTMAPADASIPDFRGFLLGVVRNVARRFEQKQQRSREKQVPSDLHISQLQSDEAHLSQVFDRAYARNVMREAAELQSVRAKQRGADAELRVELLRLRFHEGLPIREIAKLWQMPPARVHHEYAKARDEFRAALCETVAGHASAMSEPGNHESAISPDSAANEAERLLDLLE